MNKYQQMEFFLIKNHGYLFTSEVEKASISRTYLARFVKENQLEKVAKGIFISPDTWPDELYILSICSPRIPYWGETALYNHRLIDGHVRLFKVTTKYNQTRLREQGSVFTRKSRKYTSWESWK
ncbi:MAG: type IV toxin-antitoxin system AbiEi family antitoxin domain-containing protein [Lachnospiraceae bacterium]